MLAINRDDKLKIMIDKVKQFCDERDWDQFHNPKDLAIGIITESSELLDIFRFKSEDETLAIINNPESRDKVGQELADILYFVLRFAQMYGFDLYDELNKKMRLNDKKYPVDKAKGSNNKYTEL